MTNWIWKAVNGDWTTASDWTGGSGFPNSGDDQVVIPTGSAAYTLTSSASETIGDLQIFSGAKLALSAGDFSLASTNNVVSVLTNLSSISVSGSATFSLGAQGSNTQTALLGGGSITVSGASAALDLNSSFVGDFGEKIVLAGGAIQSASGSPVSFEVDSGDVLGFGTIGGTAPQLNAPPNAGTEITLSIAHSGIVAATGAAGNPLTINTGTNTIFNDGVLGAVGAGGLVIESLLDQNGTLIAAGAGTITLLNALAQGGGATTIAKGGTIALKDGGEIDTGGAFNIAVGGALTTTTGDLTVVGANDDYVGDVLGTTLFNSGLVVVADNSVLNMSSTFYQSATGKTELNGSSGGSAKIEVFSGSTAFFGGQIVMSSTGQNAIVANGVAEQLSNVSSKIIGAGTIGDGWLRLYNGPTGDVLATSAAGLTIVGDANGVNANKESENFNAGILAAVGAGLLTIDGNLDNAGYLIAAAGRLTLTNSQVNSGGGIVETLGAGVIQLQDGSQISHGAYVSIGAGGMLTTTAGDTGATADALDDSLINNGTLAIVAGSQLVGYGHWRNDDVIDIGSSSGSAQLLLGADDALSVLGSGKIVMLHADDLITSTGAGASFRLRGSTLVGQGAVGADNMTVDIQGGSLVDATGDLTVDSQLGTTSTYYLNNQGTMEATGGGALTLSGNMFNGGVIEAGANSSVVAQNGVYGEGLVALASGSSATFDGVLDSDVDFVATSSGAQLILGTPQSFNGQIKGFANNGDSIELEGFAETSKTLNFGPAAGDITLMGTAGGNPETINLYFQGNYQADASLWNISTSSGNTFVKL